MASLVNSTRHLIYSFYSFLKHRGRTHGQKELHWHFEERLILHIFTFFLRHANSFDEASITLILKARQRYCKKRKLQTNNPYEYWYKNPQRILANQIQQQTKRIMHHDQVGFIWSAKMPQHIRINQCGLTGWLFSAQVLISG